MKNKLFKNFLLTLFLGSAVALSACDKDDDPEIEEDQELITTLTIRFEPVEKGQTVTATYRDLDGPGGQSPTVDPIVLQANTRYNATITVLDESQSPADDLTEEIRGAGNEHEFFYQATGANVVFTKEDRDANGRLLGLSATAETGAASTGTVTVVLKHQPGLKGDTSNPNAGETDIQATFNTTIQ